MSHSLLDKRREQFPIPHETLIHATSRIFHRKANLRGFFTRRDVLKRHSNMSRCREFETVVDEVEQYPAFTQKAQFV
jgi:hypothetical protein